MKDRPQAASSASANPAQAAIACRKSEDELIGERELPPNES